MVVCVLKCCRVAVIVGLAASNSMCNAGVIRLYVEGRGLGPPWIVCCPAMSKRPGRGLVGLQKLCTSMSMTHNITKVCHAHACARACSLSRVPLTVCRCTGAQ